MPSTPKVSTLPFDTSIMRTCKDLHSNAKQVLYHLNDFEVTYFVHDWARLQKKHRVKNRFDRIGDDNVAFLFRLSIDVNLTVTSTYLDAGQKRHEHGNDHSRTLLVKRIVDDLTRLTVTSGSVIELHNLRVRVHISEHFPLPLHYATLVRSICLQEHLESIVVQGHDRQDRPADKVPRIRLQYLNRKLEIPVKYKDIVVGDRWCLKKRIVSMEQGVTRLRVHGPFI